RDVLRRLFALAALVGAIIPLLTSKPVPLDSQPFPDSQAYADTAFQIANGNGFLTRIDERLPADQQPTSGHLNPSRYPPGLSLVLAPFVRFGDNELSDTQTGARFIAVLLLLAIFAASAALGGPTAAGIAALVTWMSPFVKKSSRLVMSDAFGALLTVAILAVPVEDGLQLLPADPRRVRSRQHHQGELVRRARQHLQRQAGWSPDGVDQPV
ncbi:MAG: hypothetical protein NTZ61_03440, partial [Proteobacteria bacterium]|nr:hypothetical protein [Pseudomonadota bacterium]